MMSNSETGVTRIKIPHKMTAARFNLNAAAVATTYGFYSQEVSSPGRQCPDQIPSSS